MTQDNPDPAEPSLARVLPPFAALRAFECVGRLGGIRKASVSLVLDHTVVSRHVRSLEKWLDVPLFKRTGGRLILTQKGELYHRRVSAALLELASATTELTRIDDQSVLRIWCVPGFVAQWLADRLAEFERLWPEIRIELRPTDRAANLALHEADIDIRYYGDDWPPQPGGRGMRHVELARPPLMAVASADVARKLASFSHVSELVQGPLLHEEHDEQWRAWFTKNGVNVPEHLPGPLLWHAHLAIAAARRGQGVALASTYLVEHDLENGSVVEITLPGSRQVAIGGYAFLAREDRWLSPSIAKLRRYLQSEASQ